MYHFLSRGSNKRSKPIGKLALGMVVLTALGHLTPGIAKDDETAVPAGAKTARSAAAANVTISLDNDVHIRDQLADYFSQLNANHVPTKILLEKGAVLFGDLIKANDGQPGSPPAGPTLKGSAPIAIGGSTSAGALNYGSFFEALNDLEHATLFDTSLWPGKDAIKADSQYLQEQSGIVPLVLATIEYNSIPEDELGPDNQSGAYYQPESPGPVGDTRLFVGSVLGTPVVYGPNPTFIFTEKLFVNNTGRKIADLVLTVRGKKQTTTYKIQPGLPFTVNLANPSIRVENSYTLNFTMDGKKYETDSVFTYTGDHSTTGAPAAPGGRTTVSNACYDMPAVTANLAYQGVKNTLNMRIYPAYGTVSGSVVNDGGCFNGSNPQLKQVMVIVDGFDAFNNRTHDSIWEDFGQSMRQFRQAGFDLVVPDYRQGNDYIQRNGLALRKLITDVIPTWLADDGDPRLVVMSGSMGGQVSNYALSTAEAAGETHNVALFFAIDSPFKGANIPIGMQGLVEFLAPLAEEGAAFLQALNSPAASQQLLVNRYDDPNIAFPGVFATLPEIWYQPKPEFHDYYGELHQLGLPQQSRNIGIASGSGTGTNVFGYVPEANPKVTMNRVNWSTSLFGIVVGRFILDARTDHGGQFFYGRIKNPIPFINGEPSSRTLRLSLDHGDRWDTAPGGYRTSPQEVSDAYNSSGSSKGTMSSPLDKHSFVPLFSALYLDVDDPYYIPANDPNLFDRTAFDAIWYEKCNVEHVTATSGSSELIFAELSAFLTGNPPPQPELPLEHCHTPEDNYPVPVCIVNFDPLGISNPRYVEFDGSDSHVPRGVITSYRWDYDDANGGPDGGGPYNSHVYTLPPGSPGYLAKPTLTVTDSNGNSWSTLCDQVPVGIDY